MNSAFYTGLAGMKSHQYAIDVNANNIANVNTAGYKASSVEFSDLLSQTMTDTSLQSQRIGNGSLVTGTRTDFSTGAFVDSGSKYDLVIEGQGWFGMVDGAGNKSYTRNGQFSRDLNGFLVSATGAYVTGTSANNIVNGAVRANYAESITMTGASEQTPIMIPENLTMPSVPSTFVNFKGPLDPTKIEKPTANGGTVEVANVEVYRSDVYDGQGNKNRLDITFTKNVPQASTSTTWLAESVLRDANGAELSRQTGQLDFNSTGALTGNTLTSIDNNGAPLALNFGSLYDPNVVNSGYDGLVSLSGLDSSRDVERDGSGPGVLENYEVDDAGNIIAAFSNGKSLPIAKLAVFQFRNEEGLESVGDSLYEASANSGEASFFTDAAGNLIEVSNVKSRKIEVSNLNISTALTDLIVMQKAFDANSKSITTADQLIQNAINMKR